MMKRFLLLVLFLACVSASAQDHCFLVENGAVKWQKVFQAEGVNVKDVAYNLQTEGHFKDIESGDGIVTCELRKLSLDYKGAGFKRMSLPLYVVNDTYSGFVTVQLKEDRYRVTVDRIRCFNSHYGDGSLEDFAVGKEGALDPAFLKAAAAVLEYTFDGLFSGLAKQVDDEW